jgi:hypothetical protein
MSAVVGQCRLVPGTDRVDRSSRPISQKVESTEKLSAIDRYFVESIEVFKSRVDRFTDDWSTPDSTELWPFEGPLWANDGTVLGLAECRASRRRPHLAT